MKRKYQNAVIYRKKGSYLKIEYWICKVYISEGVNLTDPMINFKNKKIKEEFELMWQFWSRFIIIFFIF